MIDSPNQRHPYFARIISNIGWLTVDRILRLGVGVLVTVAIARHLGPENFGKLNYGLAMFALIAGHVQINCNNDMATLGFICERAGPISAPFVLFRQEKHSETFSLQAGCANLNARCKKPAAAPTTAIIIWTRSSEWPSPNSIV